MPTASESSADFDVGIIGAGPAGTALAAYLARSGLQVVLFEGSLYPRPHVGESLVQASNRVLREIGVIDKMDELKFPRKYGAKWTSAADDRVYSHDWSELVAAADRNGVRGTGASVAFGERPEFDPLPYTWHVDRGLFDNMLLQHAASLGASVYEGIRVDRVDFSGPGGIQNICYKIGKQEIKTRVRLVVDASGRRTLLGNQLKLKVKDPVFDQFGLHAWFEGFDRGGEADADYIFIHFLPISNSWVWQIPITDTVTSFGVVTQRAHFPRSRTDRQEFFWECIKSRPEMYERLKASKQIRPLTEEGDYSYVMKHFSGDGFVLVGDAARFVDPIFSSGVSIALNGARYAHFDILEALKTGDTSRAAFRRYEEKLSQGSSIWYRFITLYYRLNILFTWYLNKPETRMQVLRLLQGDVYDEAEVPVLDEMRKMVEDIEANPRHVLHRHLGTLTANAFRPSALDSPTA